ncbi:PadR family transcriptional regulator [Pseudonocardia sp.]|uniref:PadR family transcriptional regulator n=1 Tax=Pseudonocardia sp. TaxID=60912 RepID=UPI003D0CE9F8
MKHIDNPWGGFGRPPFAHPGRGGGPGGSGDAAEHDDPRVRRLRAHRRGHRHGGPPFGPGFPFPPRGFGRGRGRRSARGDVRLAVLALVAEQPRHGYEIIQEIAERTGGAWRPSPGSVYPTLSQLQDEGLVTVEKTAGRRIVELTEAGTAYVEEHRAELDAVWENATADSDEGAATLWEQLGQLHAAAGQVMSAGTPEQIEAATAAITEARKAIYRLLAE